MDHEGDAGAAPGFWWGTASSSTQYEGAAPRSDWARWEASGHVPGSRDGNGFATRFAEDLALLAEHHLTHHRLTLDWARLEPHEGRHDGEAVEHHLAVLRAARDAGVSIWACLHHVALPGWFADDQGGFVDERGRSRTWARHVDWVGETFGDLVAGWMPIHEPFAYAAAGWRHGRRPPGRADARQHAEALEATWLAQHEAWRLLRSGGRPVATLLDLTVTEPGVRSREPDERDAAARHARAADAGTWTVAVRALRDGILAVPGLAEREIDGLADSFDLVGVTYRGARTVYADGSVGPYPADVARDPLGGAPWAEGLGVVLRRLADELPRRALLVGGHDVVTAPGDDDRRCDELERSLGEVRRAVHDGVDVRGFFHATAVDGYEWEAGFSVTTGLFDRDRNAKASAVLAARWAEEGRP